MYNIAERMVDNPTLRMGEIFKSLVGRTMANTDRLSVNKYIKQIIRRYKKEGRMTQSVQNNVVRKKEIKTRAKSKSVKNVNRGRFIMRRKSFLMKNEKIDRSRASKIACDEYNQFNDINDNLDYYVTRPLSQSIFSSKMTDRPKVVPDSNLNKILFDMIRNIVRNKTKMNYDIDGKILMCETVYDWEILLSKIMGASSDIARNLNIENKFQVTGFGKNKELIYR